MKRALTHLILWLHLLVLGSLIFGNPSPKKKRPIAVHSVRLTTPHEPKRVALPSQKPSKSSPPVATSAPKTPPSAKKVVKTTKKGPAVSQKLAKELEERIAKIDENRDKFKVERHSAMTKSPSQAPLVLQSLEKDSVVEIKELLVSELKGCLHLPDFGEVTMRLILRPDGSVAEIKVLKSASKKNSEYLEKELPKQCFSFVADLGLKDSERNFVVTFCNEL